MKITWIARGVNEAQELRIEETSFVRLYAELIKAGIIKTSSLGPYENAQLNKIEKSMNDFIVKGKDGREEFDRDSYDDAISSVYISDIEIKNIIQSETSNTYYQRFERSDGDRIIEITDEDFDKDGDYKYQA